MSTQNITAFESQYQDILVSTSRTIKSLIDNCARKEKVQKVSAAQKSRKLISNYTIGLRNLASFSQTQPVAMVENQVMRFHKKVKSLSNSTQPIGKYFIRNLSKMSSISIFMDASGVQINIERRDFHKFGKCFILTSIESAQKLDSFQKNVYVFGSEAKLARDLLKFSASYNDNEAFDWLFDTLSNYTKVLNISLAFEASVRRYLDDAELQINILKRPRT